MSSSSTRSSMESATLKQTFEDDDVNDGDDVDIEDNDDDDNDLDAVDPGGEGERLEQRGGGEGLHLDRDMIPI